MTGTVKVMKPEKPTLGLPYQNIWDETPGDTYDERALAVWDRLYDLWIDLYEGQIGSLGRVESQRIGTVEYVHDTRQYPYDEPFDFRTMVDDRVIVAMGISKNIKGARDRFAMRAPPCIHEFGERPEDCAFDRGHFIAFTLGGIEEIGLFPQHRDVNRGMGEYGKKYVAMERYARNQPGTFLFSRPIYGDNTRHPFWIEFGLVKSDGNFWVEVFPNRYTFTPYLGKEQWPDWLITKISKETATFERSRIRHQKKLERERATGKHL